MAGIPGTVNKIDKRVCKMLRIVELRGDPRRVVVADERPRRKAPTKPRVAIERMRQLEEVAVVERAPDGFPQLVLRNAGKMHVTLRCVRSRRE